MVTDFVSDDLEIERLLLGDVAIVEACAAEAERELAARVDEASALMVYHMIEITADNSKIRNP